MSGVVHNEERDHNMRQIVAYKRLKTMENYRAVKEKVIALAYGRWSIMRSSNYRALGEKILVTILYRWSLMGVGRLQEVVAH